MHILIVLSILLLLPAYGQHFYPIVRHDVYPQSLIASEGANYSLLQDNNGLMYVSTGKGIFRFNGISRERVQGLDKHVISMVLYSPNNRVYVRTEEGLGYIRQMQDGKLRYEQIVAGPKYKMVESDYLDRNTGQLDNNNYQMQLVENSLYFMADGKVYRMQLPGGKPEVMYNLGSSVPSGWCTIGGQIFILIQDKGMRRLAQNKLINVPVYRNLGGERIIFATRYNNEYALISTGSRLYLCASDKYHTLSGQDLPENQVDGVVTEKHIVIGTASSGCVVYRKATDRLVQDYSLNVATNLPDDNVRKVYVDRDNRLWLAHPYSVSWVWADIPLSNIPGLGQRIKKMVSYRGRLYIARDGGIAYLRNREDGGSLSTEALITLRMQAQSRNRRLQTIATTNNSAAVNLDKEKNEKGEQIEKLNKEIAALRKKTFPNKKLIKEKEQQRDRLLKDVQMLDDQAVALYRQRPVIAETEEPEDTRLTYALQEISREQRTVPTGIYASVEGTEGKTIEDMVVWNDRLLATTGRQILVIDGKKVVQKIDVAAALLVPSRFYKNTLYFVHDNYVGALRYDADKKKWILPRQVDFASSERDVSYIPSAKNLVANIRLTSLAEDQKRNLWVGSDDGLFVINPDQGFGVHNNLEKRQIQKKCKVVQVGNAVVVTSDVSVYVIQNGKAERSTMLNRYLGPEGLIAEYENYWYTIRNSLLYKLNRGATTVADSSVVPRLLKNVNGMVGHSRHLYLTDEQGLHSYQLGAQGIRIPTYAVPVSITYIRVQRDTSLAEFFRFTEEGLELDYSADVNLEIGLNAPFYNNDAVTYEYRKSADKPWKRLEASKLVIEDLQPGEYNIEIRAIDAFGNGGKVRVVKVELLAPLYQRWWFILLMVLAGVAGVVYGSMRVQDYRQRRLRQRAEELELKVEQRTDELRREKEATEQLNQVLARQKDELEDKNKEIAAQRETIAQQERMAGLGEIAPIMAHEINSPLGAIRSSTENMRSSLPGTLQRFPVFVGMLSHQLQSQFWLLLQQMMTRETNLTLTQERNETARLQQELEDVGVANARSIAQKLVKGGYNGAATPLLPFLQADAHAAQLPDVIMELGMLFKQLNLVHSSIARAQNIINRLKNTVHRRADLDKPIPMDLRETWENVLGLYDYHLRQGIEVVLDLPEEMPELQGFPEELQQVWTNLLMNAVYVLKNSGKIEIRGVVVGGAFQLTFSDNGPGIPPEIVARVFEPMFTTKPKGEGTGLGLSIAKKIIEEKHHGSLQVSSQPGRTVFTITLPIDLPQKS